MDCFTQNYDTDETIRIDIGVYTALEIDLTNVDFTGISEIVFSVKNSADVSEPVLFERTYTEPRLYHETITPEESLLLKNGAVYDFNEVLENGTRYKMSDNGKIILRRGVGQCQIE